MALYEYSCSDCGNTYEEIRKISERDEEGSCRIDDCGGIAVRVNALSTSFAVKGRDRRTPFERVAQAIGKGMGYTD